MATHSSILAWEIPWTEEPGLPQSVGSQRIRHNLVTKQQQLYVYLHLLNKKNKNFLLSNTQFQNPGGTISPVENACSRKPNLAQCRHT